MDIDRNTINQLKRFSQVFEDARKRDANESDTVMFLIKFFEEVFGYDALTGEISKEVAIKDRYCDFAVKLNGEIKLLVEVKAVGNKSLREKDIEQAENYASRSGLKWILLTNGIEWRLYHVTFNEGEGIVHELAFETSLPLVNTDQVDQLWTNLKLLGKDTLKRDLLENYWNQKKVLAPKSLLRVLFSKEVLTLMRRELNRQVEARLELTEVFEAVKKVLSNDALSEAADIRMIKRRKKRRKIKQVDAVTGQTSEVEIETDEEEDVEISKETTSSVSPAPAG